MEFTGVSRQTWGNFRESIVQIEVEVLGRHGIA
jgi:hypothetical protein